MQIPEGTVRSESHIWHWSYESLLQRRGKAFPTGDENGQAEAQKTIVTSVFTYIYAVCKWPVDCSLSTKIIALSGTLGGAGDRAQDYHW